MPRSGPRTTRTSMVPNWAEFRLYCPNQTHPPIYQFQFVLCCFWVLLFPCTPEPTTPGIKPSGLPYALMLPGYYISLQRLFPQQR